MNDEQISPVGPTFRVMEKDKLDALEAEAQRYKTALEQIANICGTVRLRDLAEAYITLGNIETIIDDLHK